ncbi:MAG TPA: hypothetical protein PKO34_05115 [Smithellaceae bacterium]|nr:hypothetical protein [Smithellaceae bacterium]
MPLYLQMLLLTVAFIVFVLLALYAGGWGVRNTCLRIIAELEEARAFKASKALKIQDERKNIFRVGTGNIRPKALNLLIADGIVVKTPNGRYFLDKDKLAQLRSGQGK